MGNISLSKNTTKYQLLDIEILSIQGQGFHLLLQAQINGKPSRLLIDTGASMTAFDSKRIHRFTRSKRIKLNDQLSTGLGTNTMESHMLNIKEFKLGEIFLKDYDAVLIDMTHVNQSYEMLGIPSIDGVLGSDLMLTLHAVIDYKRKIIKLKVPKSM